ncbi:MAG TPA: hypothetical protein VM680_16000 [Verrucomicrobiae bacterium]|nr:hypothetical protein [Verrucomicrobiae bacterium]
MSEAAALPKPTIESLAEEMRQLKERMEDLEDLLELRAAVERNEGKPGLPWHDAKRKLDLE